MKKLNIFSFLILFLFSLSSYAADTSTFDVGPLVGYSHYSSGGNSASKIGVGARGGYHLNPNWELGFDWTFASTVPSNAVSGYTSNLALALVRADYHLVGIVDGLYVGPKLGLAFTNAAGYSGNSFAVGGEVGYDYYVLSNLSVGPLVDLISVAAPTLNGASGSRGSELQAFASAKYYF